MTPTLSTAGRLALLLAAMLTVMAGAIIAPALPQFRTAFAEYPSPDLLARLVLTTPALSIALFAPLSGFILDRFGRRRVLCIGILLYILAGSSGLVLSNPYAILVGRVLLGTAVSLVMTTTTTLISDYFVGDERSRFLGLQAAFMGLGGVLFLPLGGWLATFDWHTPFAVYLLASPLFVLVFRTIGEPSLTPRSSDGVSDMRMPWRLLGVLFAIGFVSMAAFYLGPTQVPFHMEKLYGSGPLARGVSVAAMSLSGVVVAMLFGRIVRRMALPWILAVMQFGVALGLLTMAYASSEPITWLGLVIAGAASGLMVPALSSWLMRLTPPHRRGQITGLMMSAMFWGQFLSPILVQGEVRRGGTIAAFETVGVVMLVIATLYAIGVLVTARVKKH
jgi:MFS family permease